MNTPDKQAPQNTEEWTKEFRLTFTSTKEPNWTACQTGHLIEYIADLLHALRTKHEAALVGAVRKELLEHIAIIDTKMKNDPNNPVLIAGLLYWQTVAETRLKAQPHE